MVIKSFEIDWEGKLETVEFETDLPFGEIESIVSSCIDMTDLNNVKAKIPQYRSMMFLKTLRKAPFTINDSTTMKTLPSSVVEQVLDNIMQDLPLGSFLAKWVKSITGGIEQTMTYTTSSPQNITGTNL